MEISLIFLRVYCFANEVISAIGCVLGLILLKKNREVTRKIAHLLKNLL